MSKRWQFWVALFDQKEEGTSLALFRICLGIVTLYSLLSIVAAGLVEPLWTSVEFGGMRKLGGNWLVQYLGGPKPGVIWALWGVAVTSSLAFVLGLGGPIAGRVITFVMLQSYNALATMNPLASGSYDSLLANGLWIMVFADATATLSLHARLRGSGWVRATLVSAWPRYVLIVQLLLMYSLTGIQKAAHVWTPSGGYTALYWVVQDLGWTRYDLSEMAAWVTPLLRIGTAMTWHWGQTSLLLLFWFYFRYTADRKGRLRRWALRRDWRLGWVFVGLSLHLGILLIMNVGPFSWITMSYYFLLWTPAEWKINGLRLGAWGQQRFKRFGNS
jgi:hypothetical protein